MARKAPSIGVRLAREYIGRAIESGNPEIIPANIATSILSDHPGIAGCDANLYRSLSFDQLCACLDRAICETKFDRRDLDQQTLPGFRHLQAFYTIGGRARPLESMTDSEIIEKENEHRAQGDGHHAHADELQFYREWRDSQHAA